MPGIRRKRAGNGFIYIAPDGEVLRRPADLKRIRALAIPPAWTDVWISPIARGHIQATGRDKRGRKQYRYHPAWCAVRDATKYHRMIAFAEALPRVRERVRHDLAQPELSRNLVLATIVRLLDETTVRVGNSEYTRENGSFGLTTLRNQHVEITGDTLRLQFTGKRGKTHRVSVRDRRVARILKTCQELPGQELFLYLDASGEPRRIDSSDVNDYLRQITEQDFTAKDFRTWAGTVTVAEALRDSGPSQTAMEARRNVTAAVKAAADRLGNTPAICRKCYVHPALLTAYEEGASFFSYVPDQRARPRGAPEGSLSPLEAEVLDFLRQMEREATAGIQPRAG